MLTDDEIKGIKELRARNYSYKRIAEELGLSQSSVFHYANATKNKKDSAVESAKSELVVARMQDETERLGELRRQREERERARQVGAEQVARQEAAYKKRLERIQHLKDAIMPPQLKAFLPGHVQAVVNIIMGRFFSQGGDLLNMPDDEIVVFGRLVINQGLQPFAREMQAAVAQYITATTVEAMTALTIEGYFQIYTRLHSNGERQGFWRTIRSELPELALPIRQLIDDRLQVRRVA